MIIPFKLTQRKTFQMRGNDMLDELLTYHQTPEPDDFVVNVMRGIKRQQRVRKLILSATGLVGAAFGVAGMLLLSDAFGQIFNGTNTLIVSTSVVITLAFMTWLLNDDAGLAG